MSSFRHIIVRLPSEEPLHRSAITAGVSDLFHLLAKDGLDIGHGTIRIRTYFNPNYLRDEALITWDKRD